MQSETIWTRHVAGLILALALTVPVARAFDFGTRALGEPLLHTFSVTNMTEGPMTICKVRPSCTCLQVLSFPGSVSAGEVGRVVVRFVPDKTGRVTYQCFVELPGTEERVRAFPFKGTVSPATAPPQPLHRAIDPALLTRVVLAPAADLYMTVDEVRDARREGQGPVLIDLRPAADGVAPIPGALRVAPYQLKARRHLGRRGVIFIDEGRGTPRLESLCRELRTAGFARASILEGGADAWWQPAAGASPANFTMLAPAAFHRLYRNRDIQVVGVGEPDAAARYVLPEALWVADSEDLAAMAGPSARQARVMLSVDGQGYHEAMTRAHEDPGHRVYGVEGGWEAYVRFLTRTTAMHRRRTGTTRTPLSPSSASLSRRPCGCS